MVPLGLLRCLSSGCCDNTTAWGQRGPSTQQELIPHSLDTPKVKALAGGVSDKAPFLGHGHCHWLCPHTAAGGGDLRVWFRSLSPGLWTADRVLPCPQGPSLCVRESQMLLIKTPVVLALGHPSDLFQAGSHLSGLSPSKCPMRLWAWGSSLFLRGWLQFSPQHRCWSLKQAKQTQSRSLGVSGPSDLSTARPSRTLMPGALAGAARHPKPLRRHPSLAHTEPQAPSQEAHRGSSAQVNTQQRSPELMSRMRSWPKPSPFTPPPPRSHPPWGLQLHSAKLFL